MRRIYVQSGRGRSWRRPRRKWNMNNGGGHRQHGQKHIDQQQRDWVVGGAWMKISMWVAASLKVEIDYYVIEL